MTTIATRFGIWTNRAQPNYGDGSRHANFPHTNADGRFPVPVYQPIIARSRSWQDFLGYHGDTVTIPAQDFDTSLPEATFTVLDPQFFSEAFFDPTVTTATFSALDPLFEAGDNFDVSLSTATFSALSPDFESQTNFDVSLPTATFAALSPDFQSIADFNTSVPIATFTTLDVTISVATPENFDTILPTATFSALTATFEQPSPPGPSPSPRFRGGGGGGVYWQRRREVEECETKETPEERLECIIEKLEAIVEKDPKQNQKRFLTGAAGMLLTILIKRSHD